MKKWTKLVCLFATMAIFLSACGGGSGSNTPAPANTNDASATTPAPANNGQREQVLFGTGTPGGVYEILGTGMVNILNQNLTDVEMVAVSPAQLQQLPAMLQSGEAAVGIGMACMFERAWAGTAEYAGNAQSDIMQVLGMYDNIYGILTLDSSPYYAVEDITEKTVVASTATNLTTIKQLITAAGTFDPEKVDYRVMSYAQAAEALGDGNADVIILTAYPYNGTLDSVASTKGVRFLTVSDETRAKHDELYPANTMMAVPADTYKGQTEERWAPTIYTVLYANKNLSEDIVYEMTKTLIENVDEIALTHPSGAGITLETTQRYLDGGIMKLDRMHPGAVKYFAENGVE
ncbi:TAXI family TRAP transporter solute-binding subunit [Intestinimonas butyriciproducens]|uniref:TRAP transporter solute receptor, TAXI family n=1 Tax=Intestinimonas butyriciproducens TaxID=1297617 RepID=A0A2U1BCA0_9FIRM|nr:TAXI family TRAP transporter solute-binding subunit [Intestinimonas butyriciproducens]SCJ80323.1 TRAP transporter solute receptor%2C TAXI family [uncultured Clostridium sp.]MBU5231113.1 TAXI family TRAP transporter solute-binding subunit [Intestinimonas butyriciproducens]MCI6364495.1 TAXI family TRAP transporter solute-binding subunit [Intestinimonas butyriciproducens]MCR1905084.1 TAXI family TRAP transporter solute-binding subunit [Intestinimonas butyriciproducens]MDB7831883.1 TAXI family 